MKRLAIILTFFLGITIVINAQKPKAKGLNIPLVYSEENTGNKYRQPILPAWNDLPVIKELPNPLSWSKGKGQVKSFKQWERRRNEIAAEIQHYGIGKKPSVDQKNIQAMMDGFLVNMLVMKSVAYIQHKVSILTMLE